MFKSKSNQRINPEWMPLKDSDSNSVDSGSCDVDSMVTNVDALLSKSGGDPDSETGSCEEKLEDDGYVFEMVEDVDGDYENDDKCEGFGGNQTSHSRLYAFLDVNESLAPSNDSFRLQYMSDEKTKVCFLI